MEKNYWPFVNYALPYDYSALEPFIDEKTMYLHHDRHLQTYIDNLNHVLEECPHLQNLSLEQLIRASSNSFSDFCKKICNNAGGIYNHRFFFNGMTPEGCSPCGRLADSIECGFGSIDKFKEKFKYSALSVFGSGYAWLVLNRGTLKIMTTANQDSPVKQGLIPLLAVDVWEHAYYLKHFNVRAEYIEDWFHVVDWNRANELFCRNV